MLEKFDRPKQIESTGAHGSQGKIVKEEILFGHPAFLRPPQGERIAIDAERRSITPVQRRLHLQTNTATDIQHGTAAIPVGEIQSPRVV
ncbi:MAG: hypothetical protein WDN28_17815 [Chthoniobacter sp.]